MKRLVLGVLLAASPLLAVASPAAAAEATPATQKRPTFQNLNFGDSPQTVIKKLAAFKKTNQTDTALQFSGKVGGENSTVLALFTPKTNKLWKVNVYFTSQSKDSFHSLKTSLSKYRQILTTKYGAPTSNFDFFSSPYYDGDGFELQAIKVGKGTFASFWEFSDGGMMCRIDKDLDIMVSYEDFAMASLDDQERESKLAEEL